jgi:hypothetical protein
MIVTLNGLDFNDEATGIYLDEQIEGLDLPPIRTSSGNYAGRDGGYVGAQFYSARPITLPGRAFASDSAGIEAKRILITNALASRTVTMRVVTNSGAAYLLYCNLLDFKMPIKRELFSAPFKVELLAPDPIIYDDATGVPLTALVQKLAPGGYVYPVVFPVVFAAGAGATAVNNAGTESVYPTVTITGAITNPVIINETTGQSLGLTMTTSSTDTIVIDMRQRTILLNSGNVIGNIQANSSFFYLQPGNNSIKLTSASSGDVATALVAWRNGYMAI